MMTTYYYWLCCCLGQPLPRLPTRSEPTGSTGSRGQNRLSAQPRTHLMRAQHKAGLALVIAITAAALCCNRRRAENAAQAKTHKYGTNAAIWARRSAWRPCLAAEAGHMLSICVCGLGGETGPGAHSDVTARGGTRVRTLLRPLSVAIFPSCSRSMGALPAKGRGEERWKARP